MYSGVSGDAGDVNLRDGDLGDRRALYAVCAVLCTSQPTRVIVQLEIDREKVPPAAATEVQTITATPTYTTTCKQSQPDGKDPAQPHQPAVSMRGSRSSAGRVNCNELKVFKTKRWRDRPAKAH